MYTFTKVSESDYYLLYQFLNESHVIDYYTRNKVNIEAIHEEFSLYIQGEIPKYSFIIHENEVPIGIANYYFLDDFPNYQLEVGLSSAVGIEIILGRVGYFYKCK